MRVGLKMLSVLAAVAGMAVVGSGVAGAAPASFADRSVTKSTVQGWDVTVSKLGEKIDSVPPLNQSPWSKEAFVSLRGEARIAGAGTEAVDVGTVSMGFQVGCNTDVSNGAQVGLTAGPTAQMSISYPPALVDGGQVLGNGSVSLKPGTITPVSLGEKPMAGAAAAVAANGVHVKVDGCLGPVAVRAFVTVAISTAAEDTTVNVYGEPHYL